tara:strand:+ start:382 stop:558 length:177 start_codon:yes stop_codon:yes gene_type:complete
VLEPSGSAWIKDQDRSSVDQGIIKKLLEKALDLTIKENLKIEIKKYNCASKNIFTIYY